MSVGTLGGSESRLGNLTSQLKAHSLILVYLPHKGSFYSCAQKEARRSLPFLCRPNGLEVHRGCVLAVRANWGTTMQEKCCLRSYRYLLKINE